MAFNDAFEGSGCLRAFAFFAASALVLCREARADEADFAFDLVVMVYVDVETVTRTRGATDARGVSALWVRGVDGDDRERVREHGDRFSKATPCFEVRLCFAQVPGEARGVRVLHLALVTIGRTWVACRTLRYAASGIVRATCVRSLGAGASIPPTGRRLRSAGAEYRLGFEQVVAAYSC
jgi:hypothetical protein